MTKLKVKQLNSDGAPAGAVITTDGSGNVSWEVPASNNTIGLPDDGNYTDSRYTGGKPPAISLTSSTTVANAVDAINEVLGLLLPDAPAGFGGSTLSVSGTSFPLANGYTDLSGLAPSAGTLATRITTGTVSTNSITNAYNGASGTIALWQNGSQVAGETFSFTDNIGDTKSSGSLRISNNVWTVPAGFYQTFDTTVSGQSATVGYNSLQIRHSLSGNSTVATFVRDDLTAAPVTSSVTLSEKVTGTLQYSSGIPHYGNGATLNVNASLTNLVGQTYLSSGIISINGSNNIGATVSFGPGQGGLPAIPAANTLNFAMTNQTFTIGNNQHTAGSIAVRGSNPSAVGTYIAALPVVLVKSGTAQTTQIDEMNVLVSGLGASPNANNAKRYSLTTGDTPTGTEATWLSNSAVASHEAKVIGGVLKHSVTNYSTGYLPVGPDYSTHDANFQYVTFAFERSARSTFVINVTGTYTGCWVKLPGITNTTTTNGWWDMTQPYNGSGVPGDSTGGNGSNGCALGTTMNGASGAFTATFGTQSSTNSTGNRILIRFKLAAGQSITALSFTS